MRNKGIKNQITEYMEQYTKLWAFSGSVACSLGGEVIFSKSYGYANIEHKAANTPKTKHRIWSVTKQFTAAAILLLEERGLLKTEDSFKKYFSECDELDERITIHHLLTHTSGLFNYTSLEDSKGIFHRIPHKKADLIKKFTSSEWKKDFEPGTKWSYCNTGYYLLGMLIERLSGQTYKDFLSDAIFKPLVLGMLDTGVEDMTIVDDMASGYHLTKDQLIHCHYINMDTVLSSGGMYSTAEDLLIWDDALKTGKLLTKESIIKMNTAYMEGYGYGVFVNRRAGKTVIEHDGGCVGFLSDFRRHVDNDFAVAVLSNYGFAAVGKISEVIAAIVLDKKYAAPTRPPNFQMTPETMNSFAGRYECNDFGIEVKLQGDGIELIVDDEMVLPAYAIGENIFHHTWADERYVFEKDDNGQLSVWGAKKINGIGL